MTTARDLLGHMPSERIVIVTGDDLGLAHATNVAVSDALSAGDLDGASLLVPAPWSREAIVRYHGEAVGVQLALTAEHALYRWGPITAAPSLHGGDGGFPTTVDDLLNHADVDDVRRELRAQIERAILWGFDISYLCCHHDGALLRPEYFDVVLGLAVDFQLPLRLAALPEDRLGFPARQLATDEGVFSPDAVVHLGPADDVAAVVEGLSAGLTEIVMRPGAESRELTALATDAPARVLDTRRLSDGALDAALGRSGILRTTYRALRTAQRQALS